MRYSRLTTFVERRRFDPAKRDDLFELKYFLEYGKWRDGCPFYVEHPWEDIPAMCKDRYATYMLGKVKSP